MNTPGPAEPQRAAAAPHDTAAALRARRPSRTLRAMIFAQFLWAVATAMLVVVLLMAAWRLPVAREQMLQEQNRIARLAEQQLEVTLQGTEAVVHALARLVDTAPGQAPGAPTQFNLLLEALAGDGVLFDVLYVLDADARVVAAGHAGRPAAEMQRWVGHDLSGLPALAGEGGTAKARWSAHYRSPIQDRPAVALMVPTVSGTLLAEVAVERLARVAAAATRVDGLLLIIVDASGEVVAAPDMRLARERVNMAQVAPVAAALRGGTDFSRFEVGGSTYSGTARRSMALGWVVLIGYPDAVADSARNAALFIAGTTLFAAMAVGLFTLQRLSRKLGNRLGRSMAYAQAIAEGQYARPPGMTGVLELEQLDHDLDRMAQRIRGREAELRAIIDTTPLLAIQLFTPDGRIVDWNPASTTILGYERSEAVGRTLGDLIYTPQQQQDFVALLAQVVAEGRPFGPYEGEVRRRDGRHCVLLSTTFAIPGQDGKPLCVCMDIDITAMKRQEAVLRANEQKFFAFFDANPVALAVLRQLGEEFEYLDVNAAWTRLLGYTSQDVVGRLLGPSSGLTMFADKHERQAYMDRLARPGDFGDFEFTLLRANRTTRRVDMRLARISFGGETLLVYSMVDVTDKRELEAQLRELNTELEARIARRTASLAEANHELQRTLDELRRAQDRLVQTEKLASLGSLVAGVAHELNTPIGNALMSVTTMQARVGDLRAQLASGLRRSAFDGFMAQIDEGTAIAERNLGRASALLRSFKRVSVDQTSERRREFVLGDAIDELLMTLRPTLRREPVRIECELEPGLRLDSYPGALGQVITNLVQNAVLHAFEGRPGGVITIKAFALGAQRCGVEVIDDGQGITPDAQRRIFEPFYTTRLGQGGSGLGLAIVRNIVTGALGGHVEVHSVPGQGTRFRIELPLRAPAADASPAAV